MTPEQLTAIASGNIPDHYDCSELLDACKELLWSLGALDYIEGWDAIAQRNRSLVVLNLENDLGLRTAQYAAWCCKNDGLVERIRKDPRWTFISERLPEKAIAILMLKLNEILEINDA